MHIVHIASELAPVAKAGGLADVVTGLSRELSARNHDVDIVLPNYDCKNSNEIRDLSAYCSNVMSFFEGGWHANTIWVGWVQDLKVYFIEPHHPRFFFNRGCFYGCDDDADRYLYFSRAALEFLFKQGIRPHILHLHDWQTAVVAPLYKDIYKPLGFDSSRLVFTIHNIEYQGKCNKDNLDNIGMHGINYLVPNKMQDTYHFETINLLKGGIVYSDFVNTVSPNYAREVMTSEGGRGLEKVISTYRDKFTGILNGVDYSYWNPEVDTYLPVRYSLKQQPDKKQPGTLDKKAFVKSVLREKLGLADQYRPVVCSITRLVPQKGIELIKHAINYTVNRGGQFILLGSTIISSISKDFFELKRFYENHPHVSITLHVQHVQEDLCHLIFGGSDIIVVPSIFEPCGLTQMIALKYGTIPVVRKTGGLADTVFDIDYGPNKEMQGNGYTFDHPDNTGIESALGRAFDCWFHDQEKWRKLMTRAMQIDYSWRRPTDEYLKIYQQLLQPNT